MEIGDDLAILILAAGRSRRMEGHIKQLLPWRETTFLGHILEVSEKLPHSHRFLVLGAHSDQIREAIESGVTVVVNPEWEQGMGTSLAAGVRAVLDATTTFKGILVLLCDQPLVDLAYLQLMVQNSKEYPLKIVATDYNGKAGVPALFPWPFFSELAKTDGDTGARDILRQNNPVLIMLDPMGKAQDVDTYAAYLELYHRSGEQ